MGLLELDLPPIQLHASTQTDIRNPAKAKFLEDVGFSQIVLAREMSTKSAQVAEATTLASEYFVHGALCVAIPASATSATRTPGAAPTAANARRPAACPTRWSTKKGQVITENQHLLSMKDNNQTDNLLALVEAGHQLVQDRGAPEGPVLRQEHHRALPPAARRDHRRDTRNQPRLQRPLAPSPSRTAAGQNLQPRLYRLLCRRPPGRHRRLRFAGLCRRTDRRGR